MSEIEQLEDYSDDIHSGSLLKRYIQCPCSLENVTLADWAAWYDSYQKPYWKKSSQVDTDNLPVEALNDDDNNDDDLFNSSVGQRMIRNVKNKNDQKQESLEVFGLIKSHIQKNTRKLLMLNFTPWRNEEVDLLGNAISFQECFLFFKDTVDDQMTQYAVCNEHIAQIQEQ